MSGKLNLFQAAMMRWRDMHPYNAVHVVTLSLPFDRARLEASIGRQLERLGLTGLSLDRRRASYHWQGGPASRALAVLAAGSDPIAVVRAETERQLNLGFAASGAFEPFRFFAVDGGARFHLGLAYDHFIAGGDSIVLLLQRLVEDYAGIDAAGTAVFGLDPPKYRRLFARQAVPLLLGLGSWGRLISSCRRSLRPRYARGGDGSNGVAFGRLESAGHARLARTAHAWGTTQNDLFLAILLKVLSPRLAERYRARRRRELAVASIVNVRRDFGSAATLSFAPLLGSFRISHPAPPDIELRALAGFVHAATSRIKRRKLYLQTLLAIGLSNLQWRFLSDEERRRFHAKNYAVWAGITPLQLNALWPAARGYPFAIGYLRAVATGPLSPIVLSLTTLGDVVEIALSFRTAALGRDDAEAILAEIIQCIRSLAE
ncbi:MAG TPA: hypothetical protein VJQ49_02920 [Casimicrobiaceae bacterium]|nr:hypothetical protein [Casimicrobiaceae bacterium]